MSYTGGNRIVSLPRDISLGTSAVSNASDAASVCCVECSADVPPRAQLTSADDDGGTWASEVERPSDLDWI